MIVFKFEDVNGDFRRFPVSEAGSNGAYSRLVIDILERFYDYAKPPAPIKIKYMDEEGDHVVIDNDEDLALCLADALKFEAKVIRLFVSSCGTDSSISSEDCD